MNELLKDLHGLAAQQATQQNYEIVKRAIAEIERLDETLEVMGRDMVEMRQQTIRLTGTTE